jgi:hypothetical protein
MGGAVGLLLLAMAGCGGGDRGDVGLPTSSPPAAPSQVSSPASGEAAVRQTYTQYWATLPQAEHAATEGDQRRLLSRYATDPLLSEVIVNIGKLHSSDVTSEGYVVVHIEKVQVSGVNAELRACQDSTHALLRNTRSGKITNRGGSNDHARAVLIRGADGQWRVKRIFPLGRC